MQKTPRFALVFGFGSLLLLMLAVVTSTQRQMAASEARVHELVANKMAKVRLCNEMRSAARSRTLALQRMILLDDPFAQDEQWQLYNEAGTEFAVARERMLGLRLSPTERDLLSEQNRLIQDGRRYQEHVVSLVHAGHRAEAKQWLLHKAIPVQDEVLKVLAAIQALQEQKAQAAVVDIVRANRDTRVLMAVLSMLVLGLGGGIAGISLAANRRTHKVLENERERALVTLQAITDAVIRTDAHGTVDYLNPAAARLLGRAAPSVVARPIREVLRLVADDGEAVPDPLYAVLGQGKEWHSPRDQLSLMTAERRVPTEAVVVPIRAASGDIGGAVAVLRDMTELRSLAHELMYQATHDALTGLLNRAEFDRCLGAAIESARSAGSSAVFCYLDLDYFKIVNDSCGHVAGDEALRQVGTVIAARMRRGDSAARVGGDEFALLLRDSSLEKAMVIAGDIKQAIRDHRFTWERKSFELGVSIGMKRIDQDVASVNEVYLMADDLCRRAKDEGRGRIHMGGDEEGATPHDTIWIERIQRALAQDEFMLYGQWILPLGKQRRRAPAHVEILIRLREPDGSVTSPFAFLPPAERYHLMPAIDRWVIRHTLAFLQAHRDAHPSFRVNINLSGQSLCDRDFLSFVLAQFETTRVSPQQVWFEITETAAITNMTSAASLISALNGIGCNFALDDFGSGLSSFAYLKNLSVRQIKIDQLFVRDIAYDRVDRAMVRSINEMAQVMGIETVAEGIEDDQVREELERIGVDYGQGSALARPAPLPSLAQGVLPSVRADT